MVIASRTRGRLSVLVVFLFLNVLLLATPVSADPYATYSFKQISGEAPDGAADWFAVELYDTSNAERAAATFKFLNAAEDSSRIWGIYFYDGVLLKTYTLDSGGTLATNDGVLFDEDSPGEHLPGFTPPTAAFYAATADPDAGILSGDSLAIEWLLDPGKSFTELVAMLDLSGSSTRTGTVENPTIQVGIKVKGFEPNDDSAEFVMVPVPGAALLGFFGLGYAGVRLRKMA